MLQLNAEQIDSRAPGLTRRKMYLQEDFREQHEAALLRGRDRFEEVGCAETRSDPRLHFDEYDRAVARADEIDLSDPMPPVAGDNPVTELSIVLLGNALASAAEPNSR